MATQVITDQRSLSDLILLARNAATELMESHPILSDALGGASAEVEVSTREYAQQTTRC